MRTLHVWLPVCRLWPTLGGSSNILRLSQVTCGTGTPSWWACFSLPLSLLCLLFQIQKSFMGRILVWAVYKMFSTIAFQMAQLVEINVVVQKLVWLLGDQCDCKRTIMDVGRPLWLFESWVWLLIHYNLFIFIYLFFGKKNAYAVIFPL